MSQCKGVENQFSSVPQFSSLQFSSVQFISVLFTLCDPMDCNKPGFPIHHRLLELAQTHVHQVGDAIQPSHPLSSSFPPAFNLSQHQGPLQWVISLNQVAKVMEFQLQHQSCQWIVRTDFLQDWLFWSPYSLEKTLKSLLQHHSSKASILQHSAFFTVKLSHPYMTIGKP